MSLGLVVLEEKLFTYMRTPQSDDIMSGDLSHKSTAGNLKPQNVLNGAVY